MSYFNKFSSQKIAFIAYLSSGALAYSLQPYYEVLMRWSTSVFDYGKERDIGDRVSKIAANVMDDLNVPNNVRSKIDFFHTGHSEACSLGSITSEYCFIGLPYFSAYDSTKSIPLDILPSVKGLYIFNPESSFGKKFFNSLVIPDEALKFLIARELIKSIGSTYSGDKLIRSPSNPQRTSMISFCSIATGLYISFQVAYFANRIKNEVVPKLPVRTARYVLAIAGGLALQSQILQAWKRHRCLSADLCAASIDDSYKNGGIKYYQWRINMNKLLNDVSKIEKFNSDKVLQEKYDPVKEIQETENEYLIPKVYQQEIEEGKIQQYANLPGRYTTNGNERFTSDGESIGFGLSTFLALGGFGYSYMSDLFGLGSSPAHSHMRLSALVNHKIAK